MKYMGSKRTMLANGLGELLRREAKAPCTRFVDLFTGSASVAWFAATTLGQRVLATDLQAYSAALARAVVERTRPLDAANLEKEWLARALRHRSRLKIWRDASRLENSAINTATWVKRSRELCSSCRPLGLVTAAHGGHYFSPGQAATIDAMLATLPEQPEERNTCLAAIVIVASECAASPGHTAQPFQPTASAALYIREAWKRDPLEHARRALGTLCPLFSKKRGVARVGEAVMLASSLNTRDLVFVDPPYSGVHYSRFYHVLETIARGWCGSVSGTGRYPPPQERPASAFSRKTESEGAIRRLLTSLAEIGCQIVLTFPQGECSNGLSGKLITDIARTLFRVKTKVFAGKFSTLGGNNDHRKSRHTSEELILVMRPL